MDGNFMHSNVKDKDGFGLTVGYGYTPSKNFYSGIGIKYYDERLDLNLSLIHI